MTDNATSPAEVFPPGEFIREELEARGWTQEDLSRILDRPIKTVNQIITAKKQITPDTAVELSQAFGTSAEFWLNLESAYRLSLARQDKSDVGRRAVIYSFAPVKEMFSRGWITADPKTELGNLERELCKFYSVESLAQKPPLRYAARSSAMGHVAIPAQVAWVTRVKHLASRMRACKYSEKALREQIPRILGLSRLEGQVAKLPVVLSELGVRLVFVPHLSQTKIDGAALWLDDDSPVVGLSLRHDRIDNFWFTLMHELAHIVCRHSKNEAIVDNQLVGADRCDPEDMATIEKEADQLARKWLVPEKELKSFIAGTAPYFSRQRIEEFSEKLGIHPGIVEGRLQFEQQVPYSHLRGLLTPVRRFIVNGGLLDQLPSSLTSAA